MPQKKRKSGKSGEYKLSCFEVVLSLDDLTMYSNWTPEEVKKLHDLKAVLNIIYYKLISASNAMVQVQPQVNQRVGNVKIVDLRGILHDKDTKLEWDASTNTNKLVHVGLHYHAICQFASREQGMTVTAIANALGFPKNSIQLLGKGQRYDNMVAYQIHAKDEDKYQYDPKDDVTCVGDDYMEIYSRRKHAWEQGRAAKNKKRANVDLDWLIDECRFGRVKGDELLSNANYYAVYSRPENTRRLDDAVASFARRRMLMEAQALDRGEFCITTLYVVGSPGAGKTSLINAVIRWLNLAYGWDCAKLAAANAIDDYMGEQILLLDDVRGGAMTAEEWLRLLDPYNANSASARYKNKPPLAPRVIFISTNREPGEMLYFSKNVGGGRREESVGAFIRRTKHVVHVFSLNEFGNENCVWQNPKECSPYTLVVGRDESGGQITVKNITWTYDNMFEDDVLLSPYFVAEGFARIIDGNNGGIISSKPNADEIFAQIRLMVYESFLPAIEIGDLPPIPKPDLTEKFVWPELKKSAPDIDELTWVFEKYQAYDEACYALERKERKALICASEENEEEK